VEGQSGISPVYERVISVVHLEIVLLLANGGKSVHDETDAQVDTNEGSEIVVVARENSQVTVESVSHADESTTATGPEEISEDERVLRAECMVFINMMCDYKPSLRYGGFA
jgi:hypothetical protein